jgi:DNA-binding transcriptional LysR family regulator
MSEALLILLNKLHVVAILASDRRPRLDRMKVELSPTRVAQAIYSRSLIYFAAVAETGSIREASRHLNVAASAVSRQIAQLQDRLGVKLFDNLGHSLRLAPAGEELLQYYRSIVGELGTTVDQISALHGHRTGTVRMATVDSFATGLLARLISEYSALYPSVHFAISILSMSDLAEQVLDGSADIGFTFNLQPRDAFDVLFQADCPTGVVVAESHPLAAKSVVTYEDCITFPIGLLRPGTPIRAALEQAALAKVCRGDVDAVSGGSGPSGADRHLPAALSLHA